MQVLLNLLESGKHIFFYLILFISTFSGAIAQDAQQPSIMIIPSDNQLKQLECLTDTTISQGQQIYIRNYQKAFIEDASLKFIISGIQGQFSSRGFPLRSLEATLKKLPNERALDAVTGVEVDARAQLLNTARPDIILDLSYELKKGGMENLLVFNIEAIDAYTLEVIASAQDPGIETIETNIETLMAEQVARNINNLQEDMQSHFDNLKANGRKIALQVKVEEGGSGNLSDWCDAAKDEYSYIIHKWIKKNTVNAQFKREIKTKFSLTYTDIRIPLFDEDGYPMAAMDWVDLLRRYLRGTCDLRSEELSTGLGGGVLLISFN